MENAQDPGSPKKPVRPSAKPGGVSRKPQPVKKPVAKRATTARPTPSKAARPSSPAARARAKPPAAAAAETAESLPERSEATAQSVEEPAAEAVAVEEPSTAQHAPVPRLTVARLALPKLTLPKFSIGGTSPADEPVDSDAGIVAQTDPLDRVEATTDEVGTIEAEPAAAPIVESQTLPVAVAKQSKSAQNADIVLLVEGLTKKFDDTVAVDGIGLEVHVGAFYGIVGPNGAGKTTTLSMITGLLRPDAGTIAVHGADVWTDPVIAKRNMGVLPDRLRLFDRLTGAQVLYYAGVLRGLDQGVVRKRTADLAGAFGLEEALGRLVTDYSAGMTKKVALAAAMIHSPRLLVLDEPFESVDPVSAATITEILKNYADAGGTVVLSSHSMDLVQRICDHVAVIVGGELLADGTMAQVREGKTLDDRFVELAGGRKSVEGLEWLHNFSD